MIIYFFNGLSFAGLGLTAFFQYRRGGEFPLRQHLPWLILYGFACGISSWIDMFLVNPLDPQIEIILKVLQVISQPMVGLVLLIFGWQILNHLTPLPAWTMFIPVVLIVPIAFVIAYASTTFITPSPIEIPIDIWSRYMFYLPGSLMAGIGFLRQWKVQQKLGYADVANLMFGAGIAFLIEAFVVGLVVPAAPYGPASYYNYDRVLNNAFSGEGFASNQPYSLVPWLDYNSVLITTGFPIQFWRMLSTFAVTYFVVRGLDVFDAVKKRELRILQNERDQAQRSAFETQISARKTAENWTNTLVDINRRIVNLENVDSILKDITQNANHLLRSDFTGLAILDDHRTNLYLRFFSQQESVQSIERDVIITNQLILRTVQTLLPCRSQGSETDEETKDICIFSEKPAKSFAVVPLCLDNVPLGALWLARFDALPYTETDMIWLESLADQVVIAVQHGLMTAQIQSLSVIEERGRIARDMHDGVAQVLGYLNLQLQTLDMLWKQKKTELFESELLQMRQAIQSANADVRQSILSLRTTLANNKGASAAMEEYIEEFGLQTGIDIHYIDYTENEINLSSIAEVQLVCILQEALTNVRKHAHASRIDVILNKEIESGEEFITLQISDDGLGFEMHESKHSFGLMTMQERAQSVNGKLQVHTFPKHGTTVLCCLPCLATEKFGYQARTFIPGAGL